MTSNVRWTIAEGRLHAYLLPAKPGEVGDSFEALGHERPVTITAEDRDPHRKSRRGPAPTCAECDIAARNLIGVPLWGYEQRHADQARRGADP